MTLRGATAELAGVRVGGGEPVRIMGVINASPESFYQGSVRTDAADLAGRARAMVADGADFIDVGAMSTAPYLTTEISVDEERQRMVAAVRAVAEAVDVPVSADTSRAPVAEAALAAGAQIVNDVRGLRGDGMASVAVGARGVVLMASPDPAMPSQGTAIERVRYDLGLALERGAAIGSERIVIDPGIGFYTARQAQQAIDFNCEVLAALSELRDLGRPLLVGVSRKAFLGYLTGREGADERLAASLAATALAVADGAEIVRTHDVGPTRDAVRVAEAISARTASLETDRDIGGATDRETDLER